MTGRVLASWPMAGPCTVCGHAAHVLVVYRTHRVVRHAPGGSQPCVLPNPQAAKKAAS